MLGRLVALLTASLLLPAIGQGAELPADSLKWVPATASCYSAIYRIKPRLEALAATPTIRKLHMLPFVQMGLQEAMKELNAPGGPKSNWDRAMQDPLNLELFALVQDALTQEVIMFGGEDVPQVVKLLNDLYASVYIENTLTKLHGPNINPEEHQRALARTVLESLNAQIDAVHAPTIVFGFKLTHPERVAAQLDRLQNLLAKALLESPLPPNCLTRSQEGTTNLLTLSLPLQSLPWDKIEEKIEELQQTPGEFSELINHLKALKLVLSLGVRDQFLLFAMSGTSDTIATLGQGDGLISQAHLASKLPSDRDSLITLSYVSQELAAAAQTTVDDLREISQNLPAMIKELPIDQAFQERLVNDGRWLLEQCEPAMNEPADLVSWSRSVPLGIELFSYLYTKDVNLDSSQPLDILHHVGSSPVLAVASRAVVRVSDFENVMRAVQLAWGYFEDFALPQIPAEGRAEFARWKPLLFKVASRTSATTRDKLLPALADGQMAFVIDTQLSSKQWQIQLPLSTQTLSITTPSLVIGVKDRALLLSAIQDYVAMGKEAVAEIAAEYPQVNQVPWGFVTPAEEQSGNNQVWVFAKPVMMMTGLDQQLAPAVGLSDHFLVMSLSPAQAKGFLTETTLPKSGALQSADQPMAMAIRFDWPTLSEAVKPWLTYAMMNHAQQPGRPKAMQQDELLFLSQAQQVLDISQVFKGITTAVTTDSEATTYHTLIECHEAP